MRWFTRELNEGVSVTDDDHRRATAEYLANLDGIRDRLPAGFARLANERDRGFHDGAFTRVTWDLDHSTFEVGLDLLGIDNRYFHVDLRFKDAEVEPFSVPALEAAITAVFKRHGSPYVTQIMDSEVDLVADGRGVLRLLLIPFHEFEIYASDVEVAVAEIAERRATDEPASFRATRRQWDEEVDEAR